MIVFALILVYAASGLVYFKRLRRCDDEFGALTAFPRWQTYTAAALVSLTWPFLWTVGFIMSGRARDTLAMVIGGERRKSL